MTTTIKSFLCGLFVFASASTLAVDEQMITTAVASEVTINVDEMAELTQDRIAINTASAEEIAEHLPGVGIKKAQAIVAYRSENGLFTEAEDLEAVKGIGPKLRERVSDKIDFSVAK